MLPLLNVFQFDTYTILMWIYIYFSSSVLVNALVLIGSSKPYFTSVDGLL